MTYNINELSERFDTFVASFHYDFAEQERNIRILEDKIAEIVNAINDFVFQVSEIMSDFDKRIVNIESKVKEAEDEHIT